MRDFLQLYDPGWATAFQLLREQLLLVLEDPQADIQHVGSTAIPGLPAKPVLDVDIIIPGPARLRKLEAALVSVGYLSRGDQGIPGRYAFRQADRFVPRTSPRQSWMAHHLYVCFEDALALKNHLCFRNALRANPDLAEAYGRLKRELVQRPGMDRETYTRAKTTFVLEVLQGKGFSADELAQIADANR
jgi:GrpB-like predicted nucleotidyltransferase (UPF0157 family)